MKGRNSSHYASEEYWYFSFDLELQLVCLKKSSPTGQKMKKVQLLDTSKIESNNNDHSHKKSSSIDERIPAETFQR